jgi:hypothetical protein
MIKNDPKNYLTRSKLVQQKYSLPRCRRCNRTIDDACPWPGCLRIEIELIRLLRAWVAGCGDEHFSTKDECRELLERSSDILSKLDP